MRPFRRVTKGMEVVHSLESLPTRKEGIFVMPLDRITIINSYWYDTWRVVCLSKQVGMHAFNAA